MKSRISLWMPIFIDEHLAETNDFGALEQGAYCNLLFRLWRDGGGLPADDKSLARIARVSPREWKDMKGMILRLFDHAEGVLRHSRMDRELAKATANQEQRTRAGHASAVARWGNGRSHSVEHPLNERSNETVTDAITDAITGEVTEGQRRCNPARVEGNGPSRVRSFSTTSGTAVSLKRGDW